MYTIIFIAAFMASGYLQHTRKVLVGRIMFVLIMLVGFIVSSMAVRDQRWQSTLNAFFTALIVYGLVEIYVARLNHYKQRG